MGPRHRLIAPVIATALVAVALSGSTVGAQSAKEGGSVPPVALELAVADWAGSGHVDNFAAKVDELSGGQMRIDIDWDGGAEDVVPARVQAGEADLGWVYARGLNGAGVHALDALIAPFLVSDRQLLNAVITGPIFSRPGVSGGVDQASNSACAASAEPSQATAFGAASASKLPIPCRRKS